MLFGKMIKTQSTSGTNNLWNFELVNDQYTNGLLNIQKPIKDECNIYPVLPSRAFPRSVACLLVR